MYATSTPEANPDQPVKIPWESRISRAMKAYDGSIDFDDWLNLVTTKRTDTRTVEIVLSGDRAKAFEYLHQIGLPADLCTCGLLAGKMRAMCAITLLRELYFNTKNNLYRDQNAFHHDVSLLNHFLHMTPDANLFGEEIKVIIAECEEFEQFSTAIVSHYMPVNNFVMSNRIIKGRVKRSMFSEFYEAIRHHPTEPDFLIHYCIGFLDRLFYMDSRNPYWNETTCQKPLRYMIRLFTKAISDDHEFVKEHCPGAFYKFLGKQQHFLEPLFTKYVMRKIYQAAHQNWTLTQVKDFLFNFQFEMGINIYVYPVMFRVIYNDIIHHDLRWTMEHADDAFDITLN